MIAAVIVLLVSCSTTGGTPSYEERRQEFISAITTDRDLSEAEKIVDDKLKDMKSEADKQYTAIETYGIVNWNNGQSVHEGLLDFCRQLPKGGDLHVHDNTLVPVSRYIEVLKKHGNVRICLEPGVNYGYLYPADYSPVPDGVVSLKEAMESGRFTERELVELLTASEEDGVAVGIWVSFENLFSMTLSLASDSELRTDLYEEGFRYACENNILLVESRVFFGTDDVDNLSFLECIRDAYYRVRKDYPDFRVRVIPVSGKNGFFPVEIKKITRNALIYSGLPQDQIDGLLAAWQKQWDSFIEEWSKD